MHVMPVRRVATREDFEFVLENKVKRLELYVAYIAFNIIY